MADNTKMEQAQQMYLKICRVLDNQDWKYVKNDQELTVRFGARGKDLEMVFMMRVQQDKEFIFASSVLPFTVPEDKRVEMALAVCAVNCRLFAGAVDFDVKTGQVAFRISQGYTESDIGEQAIHNLIHMTCGTVDAFNDKFADICTGKLDLYDFIGGLGNA